MKKAGEYSVRKRLISPDARGRSGFVKRLGRGFITDAAYSPDGSQVAVSTSLGVEIRNPQSLALEHFLQGHEMVVSCIAFSSTLSVLASGSRGSGIRLWDLETRELVGILDERSAPVTCLAVSSDGKHLGSGSTDGIAKVWDLNSHDNLATIQLGQEPASVAFDAEGSVLAVGTRGGIEIRDIEGAKKPCTIEASSGELSASSSSLRFTPDGMLLLGARPEAGLILFDVNRRRRFKVPPESARTLVLELSKEGNRLLTGHSDGRIRMWSLESYATPGGVDEEVYTLKEELLLTAFQDPVVALALSPDGKQVVAASTAQLKLIDLSNGQVGESINGFSRESPSVCVAFCPQPTLLAIARSKSIELFRYSLGHPRFAILVPGAPNTGDAVSAKHTLSAAKIEDLPERTLELSSPPWSLDFSCDGRYLACTSPGDGTTVTDLSTNRQPMFFEGTAKAVFSPDGRRLACGYGRELRIWDVSTGKLGWRTRERIGDQIRAIAFSPNGELVAAGFDTGHASVWRVGEQTRLCRLKGHSGHVNTLRFAFTMPLLATGSHEVKLWNTETWQELSTLNDPPGTTNTLAFHPFNDLLFCGRGTKILVWDAEQNAQLCILDGHTHFVLSLAFSETGSMLASMSMDGSALSWDPDFALWDATGGAWSPSIRADT